MASSKPTVLERLKKVAAQSAPSMNPNAPDIAAPPPPEEEKAPALDSLISVRRDKLEAARLTERCGQIGQQMSVLKKEDKGLRDRLKNLLGTYKIRAAVSNEWKLSYYPTEKESLDKQLLTIALNKRGLSVTDIMEIFKESTKTKTSATLRIGHGKEEEEETE